MVLNAPKAIGEQREPTQNTASRNLLEQSELFLL